LTVFILLINPFLYFHRLGISIPWLISFFPRDVTRYGKEVFNEVYLVFCILFLVMGIYHRLKIRRYISYGIDLEHFSLSDGVSIFPWYRLIGKKFLGLFRVNKLNIAMVLEPSVPLLLGVVFCLMPITRGMGSVLIISSISLMIRSLIKAQTARDYFLDQIDNMICKSEWYNVVVSKKSPEETKGFSIPLSMPADINVRKEVYEATVPKDMRDFWQGDKVTLAKIDQN